MANNSSSSSSSFDSSSSSSFAHSSSSSTSESSSSSSSSFGISSSSSTSESSSSSSKDSSSSSSSSFLDLQGDRMIPFSYEKEAERSIWMLAFHGQYVYAGTSDNGKIIRSLDRYIWGDYYTLDDILVTSLFVDGNTLFAGTSPNGHVYQIDLNTNTEQQVDDLGSGIVGFVKYDGEIYAATSKPAVVYRYDLATDSWVTFYEAYGTSINQIEVILGKIYLAMDAANIVTYDGDSWQIEVHQPDNVLSKRNVSKNVFSHVSYDFLDRYSVNQTEGMADEDILDIFPINRLVGLNSFTQDGSTVTIGGANYGRIFNYSSDILTSIFETDTLGVQSLLNLDTGVNLAAMDNKLYLIHCGPITTPVVVPEDIPEDPNAGKTVVITSPNGGEVILLGQEVDITWISTRSINDGVKLELYKSGASVLTITDNTSNDGLFSWIAPLSLATGSDYQIYIEWLSASTPADTDTDTSDANFSILIEAPTVVESSSENAPIGVPDVKDCRGIPILAFNDNERIVHMVKDRVKGGVLFTTSFGRILFSDEATLNAFRTGDRLIYADVTDGFGNTSETRQVAFLYSLYKRIARINEDKELVTVKYMEDTALAPVERVTAVFKSPALLVQEDIGFWKQIIWEEEKPDDTSIVVCFRTADSIKELESSTWSTCFKSDDGEANPITRDLNNVKLEGKYGQFKIDMETNVNDAVPKVTTASVVYSTKRAQYFYTVKFSLENKSDIRKGLLVATISQPTNTEITFGINDTNSSNWDDYQIIDEDKFFDLDNIDNVKVGIRMVSYDESIPVVDEFALIMSGDKINRIND